MASTAQILANRDNAQQSTGPRTVEGKTRCSQNATKHALTSKHLVVRPEEQEEFNALRSDLLAELDPQGTTETITFNDLLHAAWNMQRFRRLEAELFANETDPIDDACDKQYARLSRYYNAAQRAYYRALNALRGLQTNRALRAEKLTAGQQAEVPAITDINAFTKQTRSEVDARAVDMAMKFINFETATLIRNATGADTPQPSRCR